MSVPVWLALLFLVAVLVAGPWIAIRRGLETYRVMNDSLGALKSGIADAIAKLDEAPKHLDEASAAAERLTNALERLSRSRARLALLTGALEDARASVTSGFGLLPRA